MLEELRTLCELQDTDDRLGVLARDRLALKESLVEIEKRVEEAERVLAEAKATLEQKQKAYRALEGDLKESEQTILKYKRQEFAIKTNEALWALKKEIQQEEERKSGLEDQALLTMEDIEVQSARIKEAARNLEEQREAARRSHAEVETKLGQIDEEEAATRVERERRQSVVAPALLARYEKVRSHNRGMGVARLTNRTCSFCHRLITPQDVQLIRRNDRVKFCEGCGAVLVWTDGREGRSDTGSQTGP